MLMQQSDSVTVQNIRVELHAIKTLQLKTHDWTDLRMCVATFDEMSNLLVCVHVRTRPRVCLFS